MKQTEVGLIPDDWDTVKLSDIATFRRGTFPQPYGLPQWYGGPENYPFVQVADLSDNKLCLNETTNQTISKLAQERSLFVPKGSVIVTLQGTIGRVAITQYDCYMDRTLAVFESFKREVNKEYFALALHDKFQIEAKQAPGGIIKTITKEVFSDFNIILPPLNEQKKIAEALSDIDSLICSIEEEIEKKKNIKTGAMQELLTGKRRLPGFAKSDKTKMTELGEIPEDWDVINFGEKAQILRGGSPRPIEAYLTKNANGINWIKIGDVKPNDKYIRQTEEKIIPEGQKRSREVKKGDFILSNSMSFGRPYILDIDGCIHDGWLTIQNYSETFDKDFLYYLLGSEEVFSQYIIMAAGSSVQNLNKEKVAGLQLKLPSCKEEQIAIARILSDMDEEIQELEKKLAKYQKIKNGMMQQLLTGKIRLK